MAMVMRSAASFWLSNVDSRINLDDLRGTSDNGNLLLKSMRIELSMFIQNANIAEQCLMVSA